MTPCALTIAGSDPSGGAGIQADLKVFHHLGVYGMSAITLLTVQNSTKVSRVELMPADMVSEQIDAVLSDIPPHAIKTGALGGTAIIEAVARALTGLTVPLVIDPVMISKHGHALLDASAHAALVTKLFPISFLVTPNIPEASALVGKDIDSIEGVKDAAKRIADLGPMNVLIKGGHRLESPVDTLFHNNEFYFFESVRIDTLHTHGTGCVFSATITAELAKQNTILSAVDYAKRYVTEAIVTNPELGHGYGPVNMHARP